MAKLQVSLKERFVTEGFLFHDEKTSEERLMRESEAKKYFSSVETSKLALYVLSLNPEDEYDVVGFEFPLSSVKKGGLFTVDLLPDASGTAISIEGTLEVSLRAGAKEYVGPNRLLLVKGLSYRGGSYMGFMSYLKGQTEENAKDWHQVTQYSVK
jgi:hypothetical protein